MAFTLNIDTETMTDPRTSVAEILRTVVNQLENNPGHADDHVFYPGHSETLRASDGTDVGRAKLTND